MFDNVGLAEAMKVFKHHMTKILCSQSVTFNGDRYYDYYILLFMYMLSTWDYTIEGI